MSTHTVVVGKWHVVDMCTYGPSAAAPFDFRLRPCVEWSGNDMNIAEDCVSACAYMADNGRIRLDPNA
jgi:hypothetical protein